MLPLTPLLLAVTTLVAASSLSAATYTWQTGGATNTWNNADTNWFVDADTTLSPWADTNAAVFSGTGETVTLAGTVTPTSLDIGTGNGNWVFNGAGVIAGTGTTLVKNGTGTLTLSTTSANTYTGGTTINGGILSIGTGNTVGNAAALGTGAVSVNTGGTLRLWLTTSTTSTAYANAINLNGGTLLSEDGVNTVTGLVSVGASGGTFSAKWNTKNLVVSNVISGSGAVIVQRTAAGGGEAGALVNFNGANTYTGGTTVNSGILQLGNAAGTDFGGTGRIRGTVTVNAGATLTLLGTNAFGYNGGAKVDAVNLVGGTLTHAGNGDNGWGVAYNLTGGTMQTTGTGQFSFGNNTSVTTLASATTSVIAGKVNLREANAGNTVVFTIADGAAATDLLVSANITLQSLGVGITKNGDGTMVLSGANTYAGATIVNGGTLALGGTGTLAASALTVNTGANLRIDGTGKTLAALTVNDGAKLTLAAGAGQTTTVTGALTFGASANITVAPVVAGLLSAGNVVDLITAGSVVGAPASITADFASGGASRVNGIVAVSGNKLQLTVTTGAAALVWNGVSGATWDLNNTANFLNGVTPDKFFSYDAVTFDDTPAPGARSVVLSGNLIPSSLTFNNSTGDYTFSGSGTLTGAGTLVKNGSGTVTLNSGYGLTGSMTVNAGTLNLGGNTFAGVSSLVLEGGTLSNGTLNAGAYDIRSGTASANLAGAGALVKSTGGTATLTGANTYAGGTTVNAGTLVVGSAGALGSGALTVNAGGQANFDVSGIGNRAINLAGGTLALKRAVTYAADSAGINFTANNSLITTYGAGANAVINDFDVNSIAINVATGVTGGVIDSTVNLATNAYGFRIDVAAGGDLTVGGLITGAGSANNAANVPVTLTGTDTVALFKRGTGTLTLTGASNYTAGANVAAASIEGTLVLAAGDNRLPAASAVYLGSTNNIAGTLALAGINQTLTGLGTIGTATTSKVVGASATLSTLTINNTNNYTFAGTLGGAGVNENNLAFVKNGAGTLTLSGINTYTGNTVITAGTVNLASTGAFLMKIADGGLSNSIALSAGATLGFDGVLNLDITGLTDTSGAWTLISGAGTKNYTSNFLVKFNGGSSFTNNAGLWTNGDWSFDQTTGILTAVPEPSTYGLLGAGALAAAALVRRRKKSA